MSRTVVGLFKTQVDAQNVKHELVNEGYAAENVRVIAQEGTTQTAAAPSGSNTAEHDTGVGAKISNFFKSLTGSADTTDENEYREGVSKGGVLLAVTVPDNRADAAAAVLERHGARDVQDEDEGARANGRTSANVAGQPANAGQTMNVVQEELEVGKRQVRRGGVRVYSHVTEQPVEENIQLREEHVRVDRQPVDRPATEADFGAFKEGTIDLTETGEEAVISKTARVVEEVTVGKDVAERQQTVKDSVRRTDVEVEQLGSGSSKGSNDYTAYEPGFRQHFDANYGKAGATYDRYAPAYQYGHKLASDPRHATSDWTTVESSAGNDWSKNGGGTWEEMKAAARHGWDSARGRSASTKS